MDPLTNRVNNPLNECITGWVSEWVTDWMIHWLRWPARLCVLGQLEISLFADWIFHKMRSLCAFSLSLSPSFSLSASALFDFICLCYNRAKQHYANWINIVQFHTKCSAQFACQNWWGGEKSRQQFPHSEKSVWKAGDNCRQHLRKMDGKIALAARHNKKHFAHTRRLQLHSLSAILLAAYRGIKGGRGGKRDSVRVRGKYCQLSCFSLRQTTFNICMTSS